MYTYTSYIPPFFLSLLYTHTQIKKPSFFGATLGFQLKREERIYIIKVFFIGVVLFLKAIVNICTFNIREEKE